MNEINFKYWLQGYAEICGDLPSKEQWEMIREHAELAEKNEEALRVLNKPYDMQPEKRKGEAISAEAVTYCKKELGQIDNFARSLEHPSVRVKGNFQAGKFVSIPSDADQANTDDFKTPFNIDPSKIAISC